MPSSIKAELFLVNILISINKIKRNIKNLSYPQFVENESTFALITRELQEIGESSKKLKDIPGPWLEENINWREIVLFRNIVVHKYFGIEPEIIFGVAKDDVLELEKNVLSLVLQSEKKEYILEIISGMRKVFNKINRRETVAYLDQLADLIKEQNHTF